MQTQKCENGPITDEQIVAHVKLCRSLRHLGVDVSCRSRWLARGQVYSIKQVQKRRGKSDYLHYTDN